MVRSRTKLSPSQIKATYGPTAAEVAQVTSYLQSQGLSNVTVEPNNLLVSATGTAANVSKAFNTTLHGFTLNGATVFANTNLSGGLLGTVTYGTSYTGPLVALSNVKQATSTFTRSPVSAGSQRRRTACSAPRACSRCCTPAACPLG